MIKNSMLRVQKYLDRLATAKRYNQECIHSFLEGGDTETSLLVSDLKALLQFASATISTTTHPSEEARIAELEARLSAIGVGSVEPPRKPVEDGWLQDGPLLYRLTDEHRPRNRDEIIVTMTNGSRTEEARTRRAGDLLDAVRATAPQANQADALDAARYRFLRDTCWSSDKELATVISLQMNKVWDEKIDEAMARNKEE